MYCRYCGKEIFEKAKFCSFCGKNAMDDINTGEIYRRYTEKKKSFGKSIVNTLMIGMLAVIIVLGVVLVKMHSIEGKWYLAEEECIGAIGSPEIEYNFMSSGMFTGDHDSGGTYSVQSGELFLHYDPYGGNEIYRYEIKFGKLYLYRNSGVIVYTRAK